MYILNHRYDSRSAQRCARHLISGGCALALLLVTLVGAAFYGIPQVRATQSELMTSWDHSMIYPGQNNNNPWGPVGEPATVHGGSFEAGTRLKLLMVAGDINQNRPDLCAPQNYAPPYAVVVGQVTSDASGNFDATFPIPGGLGKTESICVIAASNNAVISSRDSGPFTVLAASKPTFSISANGVAAGGKLTVTGKNWVPAQPLNITIANCADCAPTVGIANVKTNSKGNNSGTFSATIPLPVDAQPGHYLVNVSNNNGLLDANHLTGVGVKQLAITAPQVTPTVTPSSSPTVTVTASATATKTTAATSANNNSSGGSGPLLVILLAIAAVILAIGGVLLYMYAQRQKNKEQTPNPPGAPQPGGEQFQQYPNPQTPFPQGQFGTPPGYNPASGYNQNWQSNAGFGNAPGYNQNWQGNADNGNMPQQPFPQFGQVPQQAFPQQVRTCARCGRPLAPNAANCVACGAPVVSYDYDGPDAPTVAY
jgi:hypothetical protein